MLTKKLIRYIKIPRIEDECFLFFAEPPQHIPFKIKRIYYIINPKSGLPRGLHAHKTTQQILFCIQGSVKIILDDGQIKNSVILNKPNIGIFLDRLMWHEMHELSENTILLVIASKKYLPKDYIRDYKLFLKYLKKN